MEIKETEQQINENQQKSTKSMKIQQNIVEKSMNINKNQQNQRKINKNILKNQIST